MRNIYAHNHDHPALLNKNYGITVARARSTWRFMSKSKHSTYASGHVGWMENGLQQQHMQYASLRIPTHLLAVVRKWMQLGANVAAPLPHIISTHRPGPLPPPSHRQPGRQDGGALRPCELDVRGVGIPTGLHGAAVCAGGHEHCGRALVGEVAGQHAQGVPGVDAWEGEGEDTTGGGEGDKGRRGDYICGR